MKTMLDSVTNYHTAFRTFAELLAECQTGYVPTIHAGVYTNPLNHLDVQLHVQRNFESWGRDTLRRALAVRGCRVWPAAGGEQVVPPVVIDGVQFGVPAIE